MLLYKGGLLEATGGVLQCPYDGRSPMYQSGGDIALSGTATYYPKCHKYSGTTLATGEAVFSGTAKFDIGHGLGDADTFTNPDGGGTYTVIKADVPDDVETVPCPPFTFTKIELRDDGKWILSIAPVAEACGYTFYSSTTLKPKDASKWTQSGGKHVLKAEDIDGSGAFTVEAEGQGDATFWMAVGVDGEK